MAPRYLTSGFTEDRLYLAACEPRRSATDEVLVIRYIALLLVSFVLAAIQPWPSNAQDQVLRLTLEQARRIIREQGARKAVETALDDKWSQLLDAIATGEPAWLDIAAELGLHSDAAPAETLSAAMGEALRNAPREVLRRLDGKPFRAKGVCGNCFADLGIQGATDARGAIALQEAAVAGVQDVTLRDLRDRCLELIHQQKQP